MHSCHFLFGTTSISGLLGPRFFILYTADLADEVDQHGVNFHAYTDDSQLYVRGNRGNTASTAAWLECCISDISHWMSTNHLKLNADKTELLWPGTTQPLTSGRLWT